VNNITIIVCLM